VPEGELTLKVAFPPKAGSPDKLQPILNLQATDTFFPLKGDRDMSDEIYIERRDDGKYKVLREGAKRASAVEDTQKQAIDRARELNPSAIRVERVRKVGPGPDKWRKP